MKRDDYNHIKLGSQRAPFQDTNFLHFEWGAYHLGYFQKYYTERDLEQHYFLLL